MFNPVAIDETVTLENIISKVKEEQHLTALVLALRLNEAEAIKTVYKCIPVSSVPLVVAGFPKNFLSRLLEMISREIDRCSDVEWSMVWLQNVLKYHGETLSKLCSAKSPTRSLLLQIHSSLQFFEQSFGKVCSQNRHLMDFLILQHERQAEIEQEGATTADQE